MSNKYFDIKDTLFDITEKHSEAIELLVSIGFENIKDQAQRQTIGKAITVENALKTKNINIDNFTQRLVEAIEGNQETQSKMDLTDEKTINITGLLPCPVKVPLTQTFDQWLQDNKDSFESKIEHEFKAASFGVDWLRDIIEADSSNLLPDIFISAGFDMFFDKKLFGKYKNQDLFSDITGIDKYNSDFENQNISLRDPDGEYSMLAAVPAVFLVNKEELGDLEFPTSWEDLLSGQFEDCVSLPIGDFDLFNSILLHIYNKFGEQGVKDLGKTFKVNMHPSEMVKSHRKPDKPKVTIMPYFFTKTITDDGPLTAVWPSDGAIISPIFMLSKKEKSRELKPIVDFFASKEVGEILSHEGRFPSVNPEIDNRLGDDKKFMWVGWDFIKQHDISDLIKKCEDLFFSSSKGGR